jgi:hypothetical protein
MPDFDLDPELPLPFEWSDGVEDFSTMPEDKLWAILGLPNKIIPFFNERRDPTGAHDPWLKDDEEWFRDPANTTPLALRWHQLVGVVKMVLNAFEAKPILQMDGVGLGKTIQMVAFIAVLVFFHEYHNANGCFPGAFGAFLSLFLSLFPFFLCCT